MATVGPVLASTQSLIGLDQAQLRPGTCAPHSSRTTVPRFDGAIEGLAVEDWLASPMFSIRHFAAIFG